MEAARGEMNCKICSSRSSPFGNALIMGKHPIIHYRCTSCGFIQTEEPWWLEDRDGIVVSDVGLVQRNLRLAQVSRILLACFFDADGRFLDYGGGYGLFVRLMRDSGFDFYHCDTRCQNLLAKGFDSLSIEPTTYEAVTTFEVLEHLVEPLRELREMLRYSGSILCSTELVPTPAPLPGQWWYYSLEHGQHVSLYTRASLEILAHRLGLNLYTNGKALHLLTDRTISAPLFRLLASWRVSRLLWPLVRRKSLLP